MKYYTISSKEYAKFNDKDFYFFSPEEMFLINLIRNKNATFTFDIDLDCDKIFKMLIEHKILLFYYKNLQDLSPNSLVKKEMYNYLLNLSLFKKMYKNFFYYFISFLNENNIGYKVYKGLILEKMIYQDCEKRMYGDLDLYIYDDLNKFKDKLYASSFEIISFNENNLLNDIILKINWKNCIFTIEIKKNNLNFVENKDHFFIDYQNIKVSTFDFEYTLLNLLISFYNNTMNARTLRYSFNYKFQYVLDIYNFIIKYKTTINWDYFKEIADNNQCAYKVVNSLRIIKDIIIDNEVDFIINLMAKNNEKSINDLYQWPIPTLVRFLRGKEIQKLVYYYFSGDMYFNQMNLVCYDGVKRRFNYKNKVYEYHIYKLNNKIILNFKPNFENNMMILLKLYAYDIYGNFIGPFIPIYVIIKNNYILVSTDWILNYNSSKLVDNYRKLCSKTEKFIEYTKDQIILNVEILGLDFYRTMGINFSVYKEYSKLMVEEINCLAGENENPVIIGGDVNGKI